MSIKAPCSPVVFLQTPHLRGCSGSSSCRPTGACTPCPSNCKSPGTFRTRLHGFLPLQPRAVRGHSHQAPPTPSTPVAMGSSSPCTIKTDRLGQAAKSSHTWPGRGPRKPRCPLKKIKKNQASLRKPHAGETRRVTHPKTGFSILP